LLPVKEPLGAFPLFSANSAEELDAMLQSCNGARVTKAAPVREGFHTFGNHCFLTLGELWFSRANADVSVTYPENEMLRMRFWHDGTGARCQGRSTSEVSRHQASISTAGADVEFGAGFGQICWRGTKERIEQKVMALTGRPCRGALDLDTTLDLTTPKAATLLQILQCLIRLLDGSAGAPPRTVLAEMEQAFIVCFLSLDLFKGEPLLDTATPQVAPWQVRRAESHIEANWNQPITIEDLAAATGTSVRSLFRSFQSSRGYSPLEFARRLRLDHARRQLEQPQPETTVADVALACGFGDPGHFGKAFVRAFGEHPSVFLARARMRGWVGCDPSRLPG
jgi:AraC-like DNA-binding protein